MGRRTWESLPEPFRPLPGRDNIVLTRTAGWQAPGARAVGSPEAAVQLADGRDVWVIGGARVFREFLPAADLLEITEVDVDLGPVRPDDVPAPDVDSGQWDGVDGRWQQSRTGLRYRFRRFTAP